MSAANHGEREIQEPSTLTLITRADDAGLNRSTNAAIRETALQGITKNVSLLAVAPDIEDAACQLATLPLCFGLHACLTAEWETLRWGPLMDRNAIPTLVQSDGFFPHQLALNSAISTEEVLSELAAQLDRLRSLGFLISYLDEHMFFSCRHPDLRPALEDFSTANKLIFRPDINQLPNTKSSPNDSSSTQFLSQLKNTLPGTYLVISHPSYDNEEMSTLRLYGKKDAREAATRNEQRLMFVREDIRHHCISHGVRLMRYDEL